MSRAEVAVLHAAMLLVSASGGAYAVSRYLLAHDDPFSNAGSAWEPWALAAHVLGAPILLFAVGFVFRRHVLRKLREGRAEGRVSGRAILLSGLLCAATGYVFEVAAHEGARRVLSLVHIGTGIVLALAYAWHGPLGGLRASGEEPLADPADAAGRRARSAPGLPRVLTRVRRAPPR